MPNQALQLQQIPFLDPSGYVSLPWFKYLLNLGPGTVTNASGSLAANQIILGNGGSDVKELGSLGTSAQRLQGNALGAPSFSAITSGEVTTALGFTPGTGTVTHTGTLDANKFVVGNAVADIAVQANVSWNIPNAGLAITGGPGTTGNAGKAINITSAGLGVQGITQSITSTSGATSTVGWPYNYYSISDNLNAVSGGAGKVAALQIDHVAGGSNTYGGRQTLYATLTINATTAATNPDRNYCGAALVGYATATDGGGSGTEQGAVFGNNPVGRLGGSATHYLNVSGEEINVCADSGSTVSIKSGAQIAQWGTDAVQGSTEDAGLLITNIAGAVGWKKGIAFSASNGKQPISSGGAAVWDGSNSYRSYYVAAGTHTFGIDLTGATYSGAAIAMPYNNPISWLDGNGSLRQGVNWLPTSGQGSLTLDPNTISYKGVGVANHILPTANNTYNIGDPAPFAHNTIYYYNAVNVSDPALKADITPIESIKDFSALNAVMSVQPITFRWKSRLQQQVEAEEEQEVDDTITAEIDENAVEVREGAAYHVKAKKSIEVPQFDEIPVMDENGKQIVDKMPVAGMVRKTVRVVELQEQNVPVTVTGPDGEPMQATAKIMVPVYVNKETEVLSRSTRDVPRTHKVPRKVRKTVTVKKWEDVPGVRVHWGFNAEQLAKGMMASGIADFGGYKKDATSGFQGISTDELIPVLWRAVQELSAEVNSLKTTMGKTQ